MFDEMIMQMRAEVKEFDKKTEEITQDYKDGWISSYEMAERIMECGKECGIDKIVERLRTVESIESALKSLHNEMIAADEEEFEKSLATIKGLIVELLHAK